MATRIDRTQNLANRFTDRRIIEYLRDRAGKREFDTRFLGLKRSNALSDVSDNFKTLNNLLSKINVLDVADKELYGRDYDATDWAITRGFLEEGIDKSFLSPLSGLGGSTTPRVRIEDRISFIDSFYGKGSIEGFHSGPDAQFYVDKGPVLIGSIRFTFDGSTGSVTVLELLDTDNTTPLTEADILSGYGFADLNLDSYTVTGGSVLSISGAGVTLRLTSPGTWSVSSGLANLVSIRQITGTSEFGTSVFTMSRPLSVRNKPKWYKDDPESVGSTGPKGVDDLIASSSPRLLINSGGNIAPVIERGYWYTKSYVERRWVEFSDARAYIGDPNSSIVQDSNMRWRENPTPLRGEQYNWGIRWDGYLLITPGTYVFTVQTNVDVKIDMDVAGGWINVFDTETAAVRDRSDSFVAESSFNTSALASKYKYLTGLGADDWVGYAPITIRLFRGGPESGINVPSEPDLFIVTRELSSSKTYYGFDLDITLTGSNGAWSVTSSDLDRLIDVLEGTNSSVTYSLVEFNSVALVPFTSIALATDGTVVTSTTTGLVAGSYTLRVVPVVSGSATPLWSGRIASPSLDHKNYSDMTDESYVPDLRRAALSQKPDWWRISEGSPYVIGTSADGANTPLDGFVKNQFKATLNSEAAGLGLYGNGSGVFTTRPNIIMGEVRYGTNKPLGSNYIGVLLKSNRLGEGGKLIINALPINNSNSADTTLLGSNDLGGGSNHLTAAAGSLSPRSAQLYLWTNQISPDPDLYNKYYTRADLSAISLSDDPAEYGLPPFSDLAWLAPITVVAVRIADNSEFTTNTTPFVAPLTLSVERVTVSGFDLIAFSTTLESLLDGGAEVGNRNLPGDGFDGRFVEFYTESDLAFQYSRIDTGEGLSFGDVLKFTYETGNFVSDLSEAPKPPADRVTPFGYDKPEFSRGLCYPPYSVNNPLLNGVAQSDLELATSPVGNHDVVWGNPGEPALGGHVLRILEKLEISGLSAIEALSSPVTLSAESYSHRFRIDTEIGPGYDEDVSEYIGNGERVKNSYYAFVKLNS